LREEIQYKVNMIHNVIDPWLLTKEACKYFNISKETIFKGIDVDDWVKAVGVVEHNKKGSNE